MSWEKRERRQPGPSRIPAQLRVEFLEQPPGEAVTVNVSQNGVLVRASHNRAIDSFTRLRIFLPPQQEPIEILGRVASQVFVGGKEALGVHFIDFPSEEKEKWMTFLQRVETLAAGGEVSSPESYLERRTSQRFATAFVVRFRSGENLEEFVTRNISAGGMFLATGETKPVGEKVNVVVVHPETDETFELRAEVVRSEGPAPSGVPGVALRFLDLTPRKEEKLRKFVTRS